MSQGERVRWYLIGMGTEVDLHTPHWDGNTVLEGAHQRDVFELLPASLKVADMVPDNVGTWLYHCHVDDHIRRDPRPLPGDAVNRWGGDSRPPHPEQR
jgi:hypothetical protein